jgi:predicted secreted acid phosphatase
MIKIKFYNQESQIDDNDLKIVYNSDRENSSVIGGINKLSRAGGASEGQFYMVVTCYDPFSIDDIKKAIDSQLSEIQNDYKRVLIVLDCDSFDLKNGEKYAEKLKDYCAKVYSLKP